jgi:hypothetical protein
VDGDRHPEWVRVYVSWINFSSLPAALLTHSPEPSPFLADDISVLSD